MGGGGLLALAPLLLRGGPIGVVILLAIVGFSYFGGRFGTQDQDAPGVAETTGAQQATDPPAMMRLLALGNEIGHG
jgi:hypothetical protein